MGKLYGALLEVQLRSTMDDESSMVFVDFHRVSIQWTWSVSNGQYKERHKNKRAAASLFVALNKESRRRISSFRSTSARRNCGIQLYKMTFEVALRPAGLCWELLFNCIHGWNSLSGAEFGQENWLATSWLRSSSKSVTPFLVAKRGKMALDKMFLKCFFYLFYRIRK